MAAHFLDPCVRHPDRGWRLHNASTKTELATTLIAAFDRKTRNRGLLGRDALAARTAMVLAPCSSVHTWFMRFAIDIVFVARDGTVLRVRRDVRPGRMAWRMNAFAVVELLAGGAAEVQPGHRLTLATFDHVVRP